MMKLDVYGQIVAHKFDMNTAAIVNFGKNLSDFIFINRFRLLSLAIATLNSNDAYETSWKFLPYT